MIRIGIDVAILSFAGLVFVLITACGCYSKGTEQRVANVLLVTVASTAGAMVVVYTVMARVLDALL